MTNFGAWRRNEHYLAEDVSAALIVTDDKGVSYLVRQKKNDQAGANSGITLDDIISHSRWLYVTPKLT